MNDYLADKNDIVNNMLKILRLKDKKIPPLRSPRILLTAPPYLRKRLVEVILLF